MSSVVKHLMYVLNLFRVTAGSIRSFRIRQGRSQDFSKRGSQRLLVMLSRDTIRGSPTIYGLYRCTPSCISGLSRIIAA